MLSALFYNYKYTNYWSARYCNVIVGLVIDVSEGPGLPGKRTRTMVRLWRTGGRGGSPSPRQYNHRRALIPVR